MCIFMHAIHFLRLQSNILTQSQTHMNRHIPQTKRSYILLISRQPDYFLVLIINGRINFYNSLKVEEPQKIMLALGFSGYNFQDLGLHAACQHVLSCSQWDLFKLKKNRFLKDKKGELPALVHTYRQAQHVFLLDTSPCSVNN